MAAESSKINAALENGIHRVTFNEKNIIDEGVIQFIGAEIGKLIESASKPKLLIDFEGVEHLSSAALGTLITINNKVAQQKGQLRLANIHPQIHEVFVITKLNKLFQIYATTGEALETFS